jgi:hypothetical protein
MNTQTNPVARATINQKLAATNWIDIVPKGVSEKQVYMAYIDTIPYLKLDLEDTGIEIMNANEALAAMVAHTLDMPLPTHPFVCYARSLKRYGKTFKKSTCRATEIDTKFAFQTIGMPLISIQGYILQSVVDAMLYFMNTGKAYDTK